MTLYNATASATISEAAETTVTQIVFATALGRGRLLSWDISFDGLIAGNNMRVSLHTTDALGGILYERVPVLSGESKFATLAPNYSTENLFALTVENRLDLVDVADSAFFRKQYAKGREPVFLANANTGSMLCATVEPSDLVAPVHCKMNLTFSL